MTMSSLPADSVAIRRQNGAAMVMADPTIPLKRAIADLENQLELLGTDYFRRYAHPRPG